MIPVTIAIAACAQAQNNSNAAAAREFWGFTGPWDPRSAATVRAHGGKLDAVVTGWIGLDSASALPMLPSAYPDTVRPRTGTTRRMAIVTSWHGTRFHPETIRRLANDPRRLATAAGRIAQHARSQRYDGLVLDFEDHRPADLPGVLRVIRVMRDSAKANGVRTITVAIPALDSEGYPAREITRVADYVLVMLYDQHWSTSKPGPIAEPEWVRNALAGRLSEVDASRIVAALPLYGYQWIAGRPVAEPIGYEDARRLATSAKVPLARDARSGTLRAVRPGQWELWTSDAALLDALVREASAQGVSRIALWRLGQEDPAIWTRVVQANKTRPGK